MSLLQRLGRWWYYAKPSLMELRHGRRPMWRCTKCERLAWVEEIINNHGWCERCFETSFKKYMEEQTAKVF